MAGSGSIGTDAYTRMINEKLIQLDTRYAIDNQYTPLIGDYSGLRGGTRKQQFITPGISGTQYALNYPESYAISAGVMRRGRPARPVSTLSPVNSVYPTVMPLMDNVRLPMGRHPGTYTPKKQGGKRRSTKGMMSMTMPGELDYTTKKSSMYHDVAGHYVKSLPRPYSGGKLPSLKDIGRSISRGTKKLGSEITSGVKKVGNQIVSGAKQVGSEIVSGYKKTSPEFKMVARQVLPAVGSAVGASLGSALGTFVEPGGGTFVGEQLGSLAGNQLGKYATRKIGLGRKKKGPVIQASKKIPIHPLQELTYSKPVKTPKKRGGARSGSRHDLVKQIMNQHGVSLPVASKYIKENNLY
jgi:hypothetical protein